MAAILLQGPGEGFLFRYCQSFERGGAPILAAAGWTKVSPQTCPLGSRGLKDSGRRETAA